MIWPLIAFISVIVLVPLVRTPARLVGLVDRPGGRKKHQGTVPLTGGLCIFPVFMMVSLLAGGSLTALWPLFAALILVLVTGALDDRFQIGAWPRFAVHITAALLVVLAGGAQINSLGNLFGLGDFELGFMAIPFSLAAAALLINALNLIDGLDGLAGGTAFIMLFWLAFAGGIAAMPELAILMAAVAGFLVYNMRGPWRKKAAVFLGDAGSLSLGVVITWFAILLAKSPAVALEPISVAWILALPAFDICAQFYRRMREGRHPFDPDRGHFHYHFIEAGIPPGKAVFMILVVNFILGGFGVLAAKMGVPLLVLTTLWISCLLTHMAVSERPHLYVRLFKKLV